MKIFLVKLAVYVLVLGLIVEGINFYYIYRTTINPTIHRDSAGSRALLEDNHIVNKEIPDNIQICNFGNSHSYFGFNYEDAAKQYTCFKFALESQSLRYDCKILEYYKNKIQNGAVVFISLSYTSFFGKPEVKNADFESQNIRYYNILPKELIDQYNSRTAFYVKYYPIIYYSNPISLLKTLLLINRDSWDRETSPEKSDGLSRCEYHVTRLCDENGKRIYNQQSLEALYRMIDICREIGAKPVLITMPYLHEYTDAVYENDPQFFIDFHTIIDEVSNNTGIEYYDYSEDARFSHEYSLFFNSDHMNRQGARKFTNTLLHEVLGIDPD